MDELKWSDPPKIQRIFSRRLFCQFVAYPILAGSYFYRFYGNALRDWLPLTSFNTQFDAQMLNILLNIKFPLISLPLIA
jgi:hypothetical protein